MSPTHFTKRIPGLEDPVKVDVVGGEYEDGEKASSITVNALELNTLRGLDLAFEASQEITVSGVMPDGTRNTVRARIVRPEGYILIKAFALDERQREKDAYDIHFVLRHHQPNIEDLAHRLWALLSTGLAKDGYAILKTKFGTLDSAGPVWAARVAQQQGEDFEQMQRSAFEYAQALFDAVEAGLMGLRRCQIALSPSERRTPSWFVMYASTSTCCLTPGLPRTISASGPSPGSA